MDKQIKKRIMDKLGLKKWSISGDRLLAFISAHNVSIDEVKIAVSTDYHFANRKNRVGTIVTYGSGQYKYHTHAYITY